MSSSADYENQTLSSVALEQMRKLGIRRVAVDHFYVGEYRYTHLKDAIAEAQRQLAS